MRPWHVFSWLDCWSGFTLLGLACSPVDANPALWNHACMLDSLMLATEPYGTWGPGPVAEPMGWWGRFFESLADDPQAIATIFAAFIAFGGATLLTHWLDGRRDQRNRAADLQAADQRRREEQHAIAAALIGELRALWQECEIRRYTYTRLLEEFPESERFSPETVSILLPERKAGETYLPRIGALGPIVALALSSTYGRFDSYDAAIKIVTPASPNTGLHRSSVQNLMNLLDLLVSNIKHTAELVSQISGAETPSWPTTEEIQRLAEFFERAEPALTADRSPPAGGL